jgi:hypothetical protein
MIITGRGPERVRAHAPDRLLRFRYAFSTACS